MGGAEFDQWLMQNISDPQQRAMIRQQMGQQQSAPQALSAGAPAGASLSGMGAGAPASPGMQGLASLQQGMGSLARAVEGGALGRRAPAAGPTVYPERSGDNPTRAILPPQEDDTAGFAKGGRVKGRRFAIGGASEEAPTPVTTPRSILKRKPVAAPVVHTTIVIAPKKKAGAALRKKGGALPPRRGPESDGPPAPFRKGGHVQVPRGSGVATKGRRFTGIY